MRWREGRRSQNVEDVRGRRGGPGGTGFKLGIGSLILIAAGWLLGIDPRLVMGLLEAGGGLSGGAAQTGPVETAPPQDEAGQYAAVVLGYTEDVWGRIFQDAGERYPPPRLVLFSGSWSSGCGAASAAAGPFYCPADQKVYVDLDFFNELTTRFGGPGDSTRPGSFAQAYVIAHEVGHHVQTVTGVSDQVRSAQQRASREDQNALQVRMELQADCFAGVWAHHQQRDLEPGDVENALAAAAAVGDDMIQKKTQGYVVPESFTHGSAEQRQRWFNRGFGSGQVDACDTFAARSL